MDIEPQKNNNVNSEKGVIFHNSEENHSNVASPEISLRVVEKNWTLIKDWVSLILYVHCRHCVYLYFIQELRIGDIFFT